MIEGMKIVVVKSTQEDIAAQRSLFLQEGNFQFIHNKCHSYGWADVYTCKLNEVPVGYGAIWGIKNRQDRDTIFEFYLLPEYRKWANLFYKELISVSGAVYGECQTNDSLLRNMFFEHCKNIEAEAILFEDSIETSFVLSDVVLMSALPGDNPNDCSYQLMLKDEVVATGGLMLNYNLPYADIYYETKASHRGKGLGSFLVQELKKEAYKMGRVPAARCNIRNTISKAALLKSGFRICGHLLNGTVDAGHT